LPLLKDKNNFLLPLPLFADVRKLATALHKLFPQKLRLSTYECR